MKMFAWRWKYSYENVFFLLLYVYQNADLNIVRVFLIQLELLLSIYAPRWPMNVVIAYSWKVLAWGVLRWAASFPPSHEGFSLDIYVHCVHCTSEIVSVVHYTTITVHDWHYLRLSFRKSSLRFMSLSQSQLRSLLLINSFVVSWKIQQRHWMTFSVCSQVNSFPRPQCIIVLVKAWYAADDLLRCSWKAAFSEFKFQGVSAVSHQRLHGETLETRRKKRNETGDYGVQ